MTIAPADMTLDELRVALAPLLPANAAFDRWSTAAVDAAAAQLGVAPAVARLAFPGGAVDMIDGWFADIDRQMIAAVPAEALATMRVGARVTALVEARLAAAEPDREALRRALAVLAMPQNLGEAARLGWRTVDLIWRLAGDTATDYNHYTKRTILAGVYAATVTVFVDDTSEGFADTRAFLARRIAGVGRFERAKARWTSAASAERRLSLSRFVGRLRYPAV